MRFSQSILAGAALVSTSFAVSIDFPENGFNLEAGKPVTIRYTDANPTGQVSFEIRKGTSGNLQKIPGGDVGGVVTTTSTGGSVTFTVPNFPEGNDYALVIKAPGQEENYSNLIPITGGTGSLSSAASSAASSTSAASSSASVSASSASSSAMSASSTITASSSMTTSSASMSSVSGTISSSVGLNSTITSATLSRTSSPTASSSGSSPPESTGAASMLGSSPMALLFGAVAALAYIN